MRPKGGRRETRASILNHVWLSSGAFRPEIAQKTRLTEASVSRIVAQLKAEDVLAETRRTAPYQGGPSGFITLSNNRFVGAIEVSNNKIHVGIGSIAGELRFSEHVPLPDGANSAEVVTAFDTAVAALSDGISRCGVTLEQIAVTAPGFDPHRSFNPIIDMSSDVLLDRMTEAFAWIPVELVNSIVARAVGRQINNPDSHIHQRYLYAYIGHGVAAAIVDGASEYGGVASSEFGHMVLDPKGPRCRCGHSGCVEAYVSTYAISPVLKIDEAELVSLGDGWPEKIPVSAKASADLHDRLFKLGIAIGNSLNLIQARLVLVGGWPVGLTESAQRSIQAGVERCIFGGGRVELQFVRSELGREPASALAYATLVYLRRGAMPPEERKAGAAPDDHAAHDQPTAL